MTSRKKLLEKEKKLIDRIAEDEIKEGESSDINSLIISSEDGLFINWKKVAEFRRRKDTTAALLLMEVEVLSFYSKGNYQLVREGKNMNPSRYTRFYFRKKKDALAFREALESEAISDKEKLDISTFPIKLVQYLE